MRRPILLAVVALALVAAGCTGYSGPGATDTPTPTPTPTATPTDTPTAAPTPTDRTRPTAGPGTPGSPTPTVTPPTKPTPNGTANGTTSVAVSLDNRDGRTYHAFVAAVREPFDGATATYADGSTASFPDAETVRQFRRANNDSRVTNVTFDGTTAATALVTAEAGTNASTTLTDAPADATFVYFLYTEPFDPTRSTSDVVVCENGSLGPVTFTVADGSQRFESGCFAGTPTR